MILVLALILLVLLAPLMALIALLVVIDSRGPFIFSQKRVGAKRWVRDGFSYWRRAAFHCYKFRTMVHRADDTVHRAYIRAFIEGNTEAIENNEVKYKLCDDARVTRVGCILRKYSMDEIPQLWNVIKGEMSLVGPRPDVPYAVKYYQPWHMERLCALPGLTGLWQTTARSCVTFDEMADIDIEYVRNQSLVLDLRILLMTIPAVLSTKGAV